MNLNNQVLTDAGKAMIGAANAGTLLTITKIVVGSGTAAVVGDLYPLTALKAWKADAVITRKTDLGGGKIIVSGALTEKTMPAGAAFPFTELGVMAKSGTGPEQLYCVANAFADSPQTVTPGGANTFAFDITIVVDRATNVSITIGDPNTVACQNIPSDATVGPGVFASRLGNIFQFKRLVAGAGVVMTEAADRITFAGKVLTGDTNLYVPTTNPAAPDPSVAFPTLQAAIDYLNDYRIPYNTSVFINIAAGKYTSSVPITVSHPNAQRIFIIGAPIITKTITAIAYQDATHKKVTVNNATGLVVAQRMNLVGLTSAGYSGGCEITGIVGNVVTVTIELPWNPEYTAAAGAVGRMTSYPTVLIGPNDNINLYCPFGLGALQNIQLEGGGTTGIYAQGNIALSNVAVWNHGTGLTIEGCRAVLSGECVFTTCDLGIGGDTLLAGNLYINGCKIGMRVQNGTVGSIAVDGNAVAAGYFSHNGTSIQVYNGAFFQGGNFRASSSNQLLDCSYNSTAIINNPTYKTTIDNIAAAHLVAKYNGVIVFILNGGTTPTCYPTAEDEINNLSHGGYIHLPPIGHVNQPAQPDTN
jgi:hypothetical protein